MAAETKRPVRGLFVILLLALIVPSRLIAWNHRTSLVAFLGATTSTLLVSWFLYKLCLRATRQAWFIAISIAAVYVATFSAPFVAWVTLLVMYVVHRYTVGAVTAVPYVPVPAETARPIADREDTVAVDPAEAAPWLQVVDLDDVCGSYRRLHFSQRFVRGATASLTASALFALPATIIFSIYADQGPIFGIVAGLLITLFVVGVDAIYFWWLRSLWCGSVTAAGIGVVVIALVALIGMLAGVVVMFDRELVVSGRIWYQVAAQVMQLSLLAAMAMGGAVVIGRRRDARFLGMLGQNARHGWRAAVLQLCGIATSGRGLAALTHKSFVLSALAFCVEGLAFYAYFNASSSMFDQSDSSASSIARYSPLEGHYLSLAMIVCFAVPFIYVATQLMLTSAERLRMAARRASLRPAEDLLKEDGRPPVLFLRDFKDDQVALERAAMPMWIRVFDPGVEQANIEDVLQACLSIGPAVAIGRPEDAQVPIGAARRYVQGEGWRAVVLAMMDAAAVIVMGVSDSPGVTWEIEQLRAQRHLDKTIFVMPPAQRGNHRLARWLVRNLVDTTERARGELIAGSLERAIGPQLITGIAVRRGVFTVYVTDRRPSQVEFDATLRLARLGAEDGTALPIAV